MKNIIQILKKNSD